VIQKDKMIAKSSYFTQRSTLLTTARVNLLLHVSLFCRSGCSYVWAGKYTWQL